MSRVAVIGYGNELRRDDGVGPRLAGLVAGWGRDGVTAVAVHQLLPELADLLARHTFAVFVDAAMAATLTVADVEPAPAVRLGHVADPAALLALSRLAYDRAPRAWLLTVPGSDFALGETLSAATAEAVPLALEAIRQLVESCLSTTY